MKLLQQIKLWQSKQLRFMPGLEHWDPIEDFDEDNAPKAWEVDLCLPSSISMEEQSKVSVVCLDKKEFSLQEEMDVEALKKIKILIMHERRERNNRQIHNSRPGQGIQKRSQDAMNAL